MEYTSQIEKLQRLWQDNLHGTMFAPLAEAYRKAGMFEDALGALEIGLSRHPKYIPGHIVSGRCYLDLKDDVKAEESFGKVMSLDPENVIALKALADLAERHGRREVAIERLERLLDFDPANEDALAQLARVTAEPVVVVAPVIEEVAPEIPADEGLIGQGEVIDPARVDFEVQLFQPIELVPMESTEFQVPNDAESLQIREAEPVSWAEPPVPADEPLAELSTSLPAEPPRETIPTLDEIRWASHDLDLQPAFESARPEPAFEVAETVEPAEVYPPALEPAEDYPPADSAAGATVVPVEAPPVASSPEPVGAPIDTAPRRLTLEPTLLQLPVVPPLEPVRSVPAAAPVQDLTEAAEEPALAPPEVAEAPADFAEPEPEPEPEIEGIAVAAAEEPAVAVTPPTAPEAFAEPEPVADPERLTEAPETIAASTELELPAAPEQLTAAAVSGAPAVEEAAQPNDEEETPAGEVPTMAAILAGSAVPEPAAEEEAPSETEPELVVTETMAEIFQRQGYPELALAVYAQLAVREPGNPRIEAAKARLQSELVPSAPAPATPELPVRQLAVATTGGRPATVWLAQVFAVGPPAPTPPVHPPAFESHPVAEPTRAAADTLSLSSVFGDEAAPPAPADSSHTIDESGPSFDEFFGTAAEPAPIAGDAPSGSGQPIEDLEQFNAWLKGLKR